MRCLLLQERTTIRASNALSPLLVNQPESGWLDLSGFQDIVAFVDCSEVTTGGATSVTIAFQTAPTMDDALFVNVAAAATALTAGTPQVITMLKETTSVPLSKYLRWQLATSGTAPTLAWDATFQIWIAANIVGRGRVSAYTAQRMPPATPSRPIAPTGLDQYARGRLAGPSNPGATPVGGATYGSSFDGASNLYGPSRFSRNGGRR